MSPVAELRFLTFRVVLVLDFGLGVLRLTESPNRYHGSGYYAAKAAMPIHAWGCLFLAFVATMLLTKRITDPSVSRDRWQWWPLRAVAGIATFVWLLWGVLSAISAYHTGTASYAGSLIYGLIAFLHGLVAYQGH